MTILSKNSLWSFSRGGNLMQEKLHLLDKHILEVKDTLSKGKNGLTSFYFKYSAVKKSLVVEANGTEDIIHNTDYYDSVEDNLVFANLTWLHPFSNHLNKNLEVNFDAEVNVYPDGSMDHENIKFTVNAGIYVKNKDKAKVLSYAKTLFSSLIPFRQYISSVTFVGNDFSLSQIIFKMNLNGKKVNNILKNNFVVNQQILSQWLQTLDNTLDIYHDRYKFKTNIPIVNGRMLASTSLSSVCFRFKLGGEAN